MNNARSRSVRKLDSSAAVGVQAGALPGEPAGKVQQVERVGADAGRGVAPVGQVAEVVVAQLLVSSPPPALDPPPFPASLHPQRFSIRHGTPVAGSDPPRSTRHAGDTKHRAGQIPYSRAAG